MKPSTFSKNREINAIVKKLIQSKRVSFNWGGKHGKIFFLSSKKTLTGGTAEFGKNRTLS